MEDSLNELGGQKRRWITAPFRMFGRGVKGAAKQVRKVTPKRKRRKGVRTGRGKSPPLSSVFWEEEAAEGIVRPPDLWYWASAALTSLGQCLELARQSIFMVEEAEEARQEVQIRQRHRGVLPTPNGFPLLSYGSQAPCTTSTSSEEPLQHLITTGHRNWGSAWDGRGLLRVRLYDFAVYAGVDHVQRVLLDEGVRPTGPGNSSDCRHSMLQCVYRTPQVPLSLMIRAARNLPLEALSQEFECILARRLAKVGGSQSDPALAGLMGLFDPVNLPSHLHRNGAVVRGTTLTFSRTTMGELVASAEDQELCRVRSDKLSEALFDLYLGDPPVCKKAKAAAHSALVELIAGPAYQVGCTSSRVLPVEPLEVPRPFSDSALYLEY